MRAVRGRAMLVTSKAKRRNLQPVGQKAGGGVCALVFRTALEVRLS